MVSDNYRYFYLSAAGELFMIQKHYYYFGKSIQDKMDGNSLNEKNWEILRNNEADGSFYLEKTVEAYELNCMNAHSYEKMANIIVNEFDRQNYKTNKVISLGAGKGVLEWHIKRIKPELQVECTDYTTDAIESLKRVFINLDAGYTFDMIDGDYQKLDRNSIFIMFRVSTEFNRDQWLRIFKKMYEAQIEHIIFVPTGLDRKREMIKERLLHIRNMFLGHKDIFCGWLYSEDEFLKFFNGDEKKTLYNVKCKIPFDNTAIFFLDRSAD